MSDFLAYFFVFHQSKKIYFKTFRYNLDKQYDTKFEFPPFNNTHTNPNSGLESDHGSRSKLSLQSEVILLSLRPGQGSGMKTSVLDLGFETEFNSWIDVKNESWYKSRSGSNQVPSRGQDFGKGWELVLGRGWKCGPVSRYGVRS